MIELKNQAVCVQMADGKSHPLMAHDVAHSFCQSQPLCAGLDPWQVEEIAEALIYHLRVNLKRDSIAFGDFVQSLSALVIACGMNPDAQSGPIPSANLYRLAQETGYGFELGFFQNVERAIQEFRRRKARLMRFVGLRSCVKLLLGARNWGRACQRLNDEIVEFIRLHMLRQADVEPITFVVAP